ncbi:hypothetical protein [Haloarcula nitratireducens]|uniref:Uncharacterized protein n=1 Tax=Haloarcula nitratireducens TaxID=2487749 RepID=A0AAW4PA83_9EURY|nr:hypothetical protein [Halomicroarcula nitratireducens]MBX0294784.1 hypothetical protein [Halomicroarcula nitratireducens]
MAIQESEAQELFEEELDPPVDRETVIEQVGDREIETQGGENDTIGEILERSETEEFETADDIHTTMMNYLDADHVGRENYSDRSDSQNMPDDADDQDEESL